MIDGLGVRPHIPLAATRPGAVDAPCGSSGSAPCMDHAAPVSRLVRDLAAAPPVDSAKVSALRAAIASGAYTVDADAIAAKMIALESPTQP